MCICVHLWFLCFFVDVSPAEVVKIEILDRRPYANGGACLNRTAIIETWRQGLVRRRSGTEGQWHDRGSTCGPAATHVAMSNSRPIWKCSFPNSPAASNRVVLYDVNNRGGKTCLGQFNGGADEFLMRQGFMIVWSGWIAETQPGGSRFNDGPRGDQRRPANHWAGTREMAPDKPAERLSIAQWANQGSYPPTESGSERGTLTWRLRRGPALTIPRAQWRIEQHNVETGGERGQLPQVELVLTGGFQPGYLYELIYEAQGSIVQGLGLAGIRDLVSYLKHDRTTNPLRLADGIRPHGTHTASAHRRVAVACGCFCTTDSTPTNRGDRCSTR